MNCIKKSLVCVAAATSAMFVAATPEVSNVTMTQSTGSRLVTITYELTEDAVVTLDVLTNAMPNAATGWASIGGKAVCNAQGAVWRKVTSADADGNGKYTIKWRPDNSWTDEFGNGFKIADGCAKAVVTAYALDNTPDYMVVDITSTGGADAQRYYPTAEFVPGGVTNGLYKTTTLLMRKIMAKDVTWTMGSVAESERMEAREATHQVTLTNNYYIGVYEVTQTQWQQVTGYNPSNFSTDRSMRPVERVSYTDIRQGKGTANAYASASGGVYPADPYGDSFLGLLRTKTTLDFDLPSEAQWEFAARAGNGEGHWGDGSAMGNSLLTTDARLNLLGRYQYNGGGSNPAASCEVTNGTAIVGSYAPNTWGLYDVHGNVFEWCLDWYADGDVIKGLNGAVNATPGTERVARGGSWKNPASFSRPAIRGKDTPTGRYASYGFRVACTAGLR